MTQALDFFFSYGSTYSYLSVMRIGNLCADTGVQVRWRPFYARAIMTEQNNRPYVGKPVKTKYMWRDIERRAAQFGIPFNGIPPYPISSSTLAHRAHAVIATGTFTLAKNALEVALRIIQERRTDTGIYVNVRYEVIEVYKHVPRLKQQGF